MSTAHDAVAKALDRRRDDLLTLSHEIHGDAELGFEEHTSSARVADILEAAGFDVTHGTAGLDTAVVATSGSGPLEVGICAEYDALPAIGHACGHNIIAAAGVGAALALAEVADDVGLTVRLLGTPAEEGGGGKVLMLDAGSFDGLHAAMMIHPAPFEAAAMRTLAVTHVEVRYAGRSAHAAAFPEMGRNAADALTVAQVGIGLLRQHIGPDARVHGIVTDGGDAPNVVPERTGGTWLVRHETLADLAELYPRVRACFEAGGLATGTDLTVETTGPAYSEFDGDSALESAYRRHAEDLGREFPDLGALADRMRGSTDMANVSLELPTIHPMMAIETEGAVNHQAEFTAACIRPSADRAVGDGALAMARTAVTAATDEDLRDRLLASRGYDSSEFEAVHLA